MLLLLAGCFRPAGDSIQPTSDSVTNEPIANSAATPTTGEPVITLLSPGSDATVTEPLPVITAITLAPPTASFTPSEVPVEATATLQIITPGISLALVTPDTATPLPSATSSPEGMTAEAVSVSGEATASGDCSYTVQPGDNLYRIAVSNNTSLDAMRRANPQLVGDAPILQIGDVLKLPDCAAGSTISPATAAPGEPTISAPSGSQVYTVQKGDVLGAIASRYGVTVRAIMQANNLSNPDRLSIGQQLIIPPKQ
jgi:LysM repeat protein